MAIIRSASEIINGNMESIFMSLTGCASCCKYTEDNGWSSSASAEGS